MRLMLLTYLLLAPGISLVMRYLTFHFDSLTLCFYRLLAGGGMLLTLALLRNPQTIYQITRSRQLLIATGLLAFLMALATALSVEGVARTNAVTASLLELMGIPLTIGVAMLVYKDERKLLKNPQFILGAVICLAGALGLAVGAHAASGDQSYVSGMILLSLSLPVGAVIGLLQKHLSRTCSAFAVSGICACGASFFLFFAALFMGRPGDIASAPLHVTAILLGSGVYGMVIGMALAFMLIRDIGLTRYRFLNLGIPVLVGLFAYILFGETLTPLQIVFGWIVVLGAWLALQASPGKQNPC